MANHARADRWGEVEEILSEYPSLPAAGTAHFLVDVFCCAAQRGKIDLLGRIINKGYLPDKDTRESLILNLTCHSTETNRAVLLLLLQDKTLDVEAPFFWALLKAKPAVIDLFRESGRDILSEKMDSAEGRTSLSWVLSYSENPETVSYLLKQGADIYHPRLLKHLCDDWDYEEMRLAYHAEILKDREKHLLPYIAHCSENMTVADFRRGTETGETLLYLAVRAGRFDDVIVAVQKEESFLTAEDLLQQNPKGHTPLGMMLAAGEEKKLFDPVLWRDHFSEARKLHTALAEYRALHKIDFEEFTAYYQRFLLTPSPASSRKIRIVLNPKPGQG